MKRKENWLQRICWKLTRHRLSRKYNAKCENQVYCRCRICGKYLWQEVKR